MGPEKRTERILARARAGDAVKKVARKYGVTVTWVRALCRLNDVAYTRERLTLGRERYEDVLRSAKETLSFAETARRYGVTREWVRQIVAAGGFTGKDLLKERNRLKRKLGERPAVRGGAK